LDPQALYEIKCNKIKFKRALSLERYHKRVAFHVTFFFLPFLFFAIFYLSLFFFFLFSSINRVDQPRR